MAGSTIFRSVKTELCSLVCLTRVRLLVWLRKPLLNRGTLGCTILTFGRRQRIFDEDENDVRVLRAASPLVQTVFGGILTSLLHVRRSSRNSDAGSTLVTSR